MSHFIMQKEIRPRLLILTLGMFLFGSFIAQQLSAADISVPELQIITRGGWDKTADSLVLSSRGISEIGISGGFKFGGSMSFGFESGNLDYAGTEAPKWEDDDPDPDSPNDTSNTDDNEDYISALESYNSALSDYLENRTTLDFHGAEVDYRGIGGEETDLSFFLGLQDRFATGEDFIEQFGTLPFSTDYQGYFYFPTLNYRGLHRVKGTGLKFTSPFGTDWHKSHFYLYQDGHSNLNTDTKYSDGGRYSADYRGQFSFDKIQLEYFLGGTFPKSKYGLYRTGLLFFYRPSEQGGFYAQVGIPWYEPLNRLTIKHFYFLFEPRVHFDPLTVNLTLFWHPEYYEMEKYPDESGDADIRLDFQLGDPNQSRITGGLETIFGLDTDNINDEFALTVSPYLRAVASGVVWDFAVNINTLADDKANIVEGILGIKAQF